MNRFTRYSRISPLELCLASERLAWRCASALLLFFLALAVAALFLPAPRGYASGGSACDFTGIRVEAEPQAPEHAQPPLPQPPLPAVPPVAELPLAVSVQPQSVPSLEWEDVVFDEESLLALELPEALPRPVVAAGRTSPAAVAGAQKGNAAAAGELKAASYRSNPRPPYPPSMLSRRVQGKVGVKIVVDAEGIPRQVEVVSSSGYADFDRCAREWVLAHWRFHPARRGGVAVASIVRTQLEFVLR